MALQLSHAVSDGLRRTVSRTGGLLFVGFLVLQFGIQTAVNSTVLGYLPPAAADQFSSNAGLSIAVTGQVGLAMFGVLIVLSAAFIVMCSRTFAQPLAERSSFPAAVTDRLGRATVSALVGGVFVSVVVTVGSVFFLLPGLFFAASFLFFIFGVSVEDRGILGSLKRSWGLAKGARLKLGLLVVASGVFGAVIGAVAPLLDLANAPIASDVATVVLTTVFFVPYYAIIASAYLQLRDEEQPPSRGTPDPITTTQTAEL